MSNYAVMRSLGFIAAVFSLSVLLGSCSKTKPQQARVPVGEPMASSMRFEFAVYLLPGHTKDPSVLLRDALTQKYTTLKAVDEIPNTPREMLVHAYLQQHAQREYPPPSLKSLRYSGEDVSPEQAQALQKSDQAFILEFAHPKENVWTALRTANMLVEELARKTGGLVWDQETRQVFPPDAWHKQRLGFWTATVPDISTQTVIHVYSTGGFVRAISLGMEKVGLPDVVIQEVPTSSDNQAVELINIFCQSMVEGALLKPSGKVNLDLHTIKDSRVRDTKLKSLKTNATGMACLSLKQGKWEEGDPDNRLIELSSDRYSGPDHQARQNTMFSSFFGAEDTYTKIEHTDKLMDASRKAREHLPELSKAFNAGLQPGEYIQLKAPFVTPDEGHEWMWVEVTSWQGQEIKGTLENDPFNVPSLHAGQIVQVREKDIFDYLRKYPDNHEEGNTTGKVIEELNKEKGEAKHSATSGKTTIAPCDPE